MLLCLSNMVESSARPRLEKLVCWHSLRLKQADPLAEILSEESNFADQDMSSGCEEHLRTRLLPVATLGRSHASLADKLSALLHAVKLETGGEFLAYMQSIAGVTTDQGRQLGG